MTRYKADDIELLVPSFRPVVRRLLDALTARGFSPVPRDTLRTPAEALANAQKGVGIANSMHCYGVAVDVICGAHGWSCRERGCPFFTALGEEAEKLGLTWGGRWRRRDFPHVQAIPVADQGRIRKLGAQGQAAVLDAFVRSRLVAQMLGGGAA